MMVDLTEEERVLAAEIDGVMPRSDLQLYYDKDGTPISWGECFTLKQRGSDAKGDWYARVGWDVVGDYEVSTVWLGLDHGLGRGRPLIFETMVMFAGSFVDEYMQRYSTLDEAENGHSHIVGMVRALTEA